MLIIPQITRNKSSHLLLSQDKFRHCCNFDSPFQKLLHHRTFPCM
jgi:hypothetical protein